jgi:hypothetical protein
LVLVDHAVDVPNPATDQYLSDIAAGARVAISSLFAAKTVVDGVGDAEDVTLPAVSGASIESLTVYQDTGNPATSRLIVFVDVAPGLPYTPTGGDILVRWDSGANRIFRI